MDQLSTGETAGILGGIATALGGVWAFVKYLIGRRDSQADLREKKLIVWEEKLQQRDAAYHAQVEHRLEATEKKLGAVSAALFATIAEVQIFDPGSPALARARVILQQAYPVAGDMPEDIAVLVHRLGATSGARA